MTVPIEANSVDSRSRSRRAVLAGALGGIGVWAASLVGRANPAAAAAGDPLRIGQFNRAGASMTTLQANHSDNALRVIQNGNGPAILAFSARGTGAAVRAYAVYGPAVSAYSEGSGAAVSGECQFGDAVSGFSDQEAGVRGFSLFGKGVFGESDTGYAGYFDGKTYVGTLDMPESIPAVPPAGKARLFARDNGSGKTQLCVQFATGAPMVLATEA